MVINAKKARKRAERYSSINYFIEKCLNRIFIYKEIKKAIWDGVGHCDIYFNFDQINKNEIDEISKKYRNKGFLVTLRKTSYSYMLTIDWSAT